MTIRSAAEYKAIFSDGMLPDVLRVLPKLLVDARQILSPRVSPIGVAYLLVSAVTLFNLFTIMRPNGLNLAPDEAHYWLWSQNLDWCYYSKGPLVAWLIHLSCASFGHSEWAIRLPAVLCSFATLLAILQLLKPLFSRSQLGWVLLAIISLPATTATASLMTIDAPFLACWAWATVFALAALQQNRWWAWLGLGACIALGCLAKYTMILHSLCLVAYLLLHRREVFTQSGFWLAALVGSCGTWPMLLWNWQHHWLGGQHLLALAKVSGEESRWHLEGPVLFFFGQFAFLQGTFWLSWLVAAAGGFARVEHDKVDPRPLYWWFSVPVVALFAVASLRGNGPLNWPAPAYITGFALAALILAQVWSAPRWGRWIRWATITSVALGLAIGLAARFPEQIRPFLLLLVPVPNPEQPTPLRTVDPTCRLTGWTTLAAAVDQQRVLFRQSRGEEPLLAAMTWTLPGELSFYCQGHPTVFSFGLRTGDRHSQFEIWRPNPIADAQVFQGRSFIYVGELNWDLLQAFDRVSPPVEVLASDGGIPVAKWKVYWLEGFRGFPRSEAPSLPKRY